MKAKPLLTIKKQFENTVIAYGRSGVPLKERSEEEIVDLAIIAQSSKNPSIVALFDNLPDMSELKNMKAKFLLKAVTTNKNAKE